MLRSLAIAAAVLPAVLARPNAKVFQRGWGDMQGDASFGAFGAAGSGSDADASPTTTATGASTTASYMQAQASGGSSHGSGSASASATGSSSSSSSGGSSSGGSALDSLAGGSGVGGTTCTVTDLAAATASASASACSNLLLSGVTVPASSTLSVTVPSGGAVLLAGTMTVEYTPDASHTPIVIAGAHGRVAGLAGAVIDGLGAQYWDGEGSNGGSAKPDHFVKLAGVEGVVVEQLTIRNWPTHLFSVSGADVTLNNLILDNRDGDGADGGHNTDAFDVSDVDGLHVYDVTVYNQDDCVAVNDGANMVFEGLYCAGGHGLSVGSIKTGKTVANVTFRDSSVVDSTNGCRIKTYDDATDASVSDIAYRGIALSGITDYAIDVQQDYENGSPTGDPGSSVAVSGVTFADISGDTSGDDAYSYYVLCGDGSCSDFTWTNVDITGGQESCSPSGDICP